MAKIIKLNYNNKFYCECPFCGNDQFLLNVASEDILVAECCSCRKDFEFELNTSTIVFEPAFELDADE